jgi:hypothetical protein
MKKQETQLTDSLIEELKNSLTELRERKEKDKKYDIWSGQQIDFAFVLLDQSETLLFEFLELHPYKANGINHVLSGIKKFKDSWDKRPL